MASWPDVGTVRSECIEALMKLEASQRVIVLQGLIKTFNLPTSCACARGVSGSPPPQDAA